MKMNKWVKWSFYTLIWIFAGVFIFQIFQPFICDKLLLKAGSILNLSSPSVVICYLAMVVLFFLRLIYVLLYRKEWQTNYLRIAITASVIYALYKCDILEHQEWQFMTWHGFDYFSFLLVSPVLLLIHCLWNTSKNKSEFVIASDEAIKSKQFDEYGYYKYVKSLLEGTLRNRNFYKNRAFNIGIVGEWGTGKTSFLNLIDWAINEDKEFKYYKKAIVIKFNPWFCKDKEQMQIDFLNVLQNTLSPYNPEIKNSICKYAKMLSSTDINWLSAITKWYIEEKTSSLEQSFSKLNQCISDINLPVMIFIDDMDRLDGEKIMAVLRLVRNTANFSNTIFILPYDETYLGNTINEYTGENPKDYLEKIINLPYSLPVVKCTDKQEINARIMGQLLELKDIDLTPAKLFFKTIQEDFSLRDIKIFAQSILLANAEVKNSLYLYDLLLIEYLRLINNKLYLAVVNNSNGMLATDSYDNTGYVLNLPQMLPEKNKELTELEYRKKYIKPCFLIESEVLEETCLHILKLIFIGYGNNNPYRLRYLSTFKSYFEKVLPGDFLDKNDFQSELSTGGIENYSKKLKEWSKTKNKYQLTKLIENIEFDDIENGLEFLKATLSVIYPDYFSETFDDPFLPKPGWDKFNINSTNNQLYRKVYKTFFVDDLIYDSYFDKKFISLCSIGQNGIDKILGTRYYIEPIYEEIAKPFFNYLSVYLDNKSEFDEIDFELLIKCFEYIRGKKKEEAKDKMKKYLQDHILSFLKNIDIKNEVRILVGFLTFTFSDILNDLNDKQDTWE
jgi:Predicted P-loop ATPase